MKSAWHTAAVNAVLAVVTAVTSIAVARFFGPQLRGEYAAVTALANAAVSVGSLGTPAYLASIVAASKPFQTTEEIDLGRAIVGATLVSGLLAGLFVVAMNWDARIVNLSSGSVVALAMYLPLGVLSVVLLNVSLGQANWRSFNTSRLVFSLSTIVAISVYGGLGGGDLLGIIVCLVFANVLAVVTQLVMTESLQSPMRRWGETVGAVYRGSRRYALNSIANVSTGYADILISSYLFSPRQVGYWAVARSLAALVGPVNSALSVVVFSSYLRQAGDSPINFRTILLKYFAFNVVAAAAILMVAETALTLLFGSEFHDSVSLVPLALLSVISGSLGELIEERLRGAGRPNPVSASRFVPLITILTVLMVANRPWTINEFATLFAIGQILRALVAAVFLFTGSGPERLSAS